VNGIELVVGILLSGLRSATPLLQVLLGETITERSGVVNLGVEGQMLSGACAGFAVAVVTGNPWMGLFAGIAAGMLLSVVHGLLCLTVGANMFASGVAVWMLGGGLSAFFGIPFVGRRIDGFVSPDFGALAKMPVVGALLRAATPSVLVALATWVLCGLFLFKTRVGLRLRAVGESAESASTLGISPKKYRWGGILAGGALSGLGGASLSVDQVRNWIEWMTAGRGLVAVGLVIVARWNPWLALPAALLFGVVESLTLKLQAMGVTISPYLLSTLPYLVCLTVLVWGSARARAKGGMPRDLAQVFSRTE
jgi:general nucleoside transport system permease protein